MAKFWTNLADNIGSGGASWFGKLLAGLGSSIFRAIGVSLGESMSNRDKETMDYQDEINDENAEVAFRHQKEFQEAYLTPEKQIISQAQGYEAIGMNKMAMAGTQPGATSASAPQAAAPSGVSAFNPADLLGTLLNYKLGQRKLDIEEALLPFRQNELGTRSDLNAIKRYEIETLLPNRIENLDASTELMKEKINTEYTQQLLNESGISRNEAAALVDIRDAAIKAIDGQNRQRFLDTEIELNEANTKLAQAAASRDYAQVKEITQNIENLKAEHDKILKETIGVVLENGKLSHEFEILGVEAGNAETRVKQENAGRVVDMVCNGINTVTGVVSTAITGVNASSLRTTARASESRANSYRMDVMGRLSRPARRRP